MKDLNALLEKSLAMCDAVGIPYGKITSIGINNRLSRCWGRCLTKDYKHYWIEIQGKFAKDEFSTDDAVIAVIIHEIIHTCDGCWNHGEKFLSYGRRITEKYGIKVSATDSAENLTINVIEWKNSKRYAATCAKCGYVSYKDRMCDLIRYPMMYTHKDCGGRFERTK